MSIQTIVTHDRCVDGYLSALILKRAFPEANIIPLRHGSPEHAALEPAPGMIFCDMSPPVMRAAAFFDAGAIVLDHHVSGKAIFDLPNRTEGSVYSDEPGISGAVLAARFTEQTDISRWSYGCSIGYVAQLIGMYDTWQKAHSKFREACEAHAALDLLMDVHPITSDVHATTVEYITTSWSMLENLGRMLFERSEAVAKRIASEAKIVDVDGTRVALLPHASHGAAVVNRAAEHLTANADLTVAGIDWEPKSISLRSRGDVDCQAIAKKLGGGGHRGAAGFTVPIDEQDDPSIFAVLAEAICHTRTTR